MASSSAGGLEVIFTDQLEKAFARPVTIVVRGMPGVGKSLFSLQLAYRYFCQELDYHVQYWDLEQSPGVPDRLIADFDWGKPQNPELWDLRNARFKFADLVKAIDEYEPLGRKHGLLVVDSLSSIDNRPTRRQVDQVRERLSTSGTSTLLVLEERHETDRRYQWADYLADIVISMGVDYRAGYASRVLEVVKCRGQRVERGRHPYSITSKEGAALFGADTGGVCIHPSLSCRLSVSGRRIQQRTTEDQSTRKRWLIGVEGIRGMIGQDGMLGQDESMILLGEGGCQKSAVAFHTLVPPVKAGERVLIMLFGISKERLLGEMKSYEELSPLIAGDGQEVSPRVALLQVEPGYEAPERILARLETLVRAAEAKQDPFARAVIVDLGNIPDGFPCCQDQPMFTIALHQFLMECGIAPVFVETSHRGEHPYSGHVANWTSVVLEFRHLAIYGHERIGVRVRRREGPDVSGDFRELRVVPEGEKKSLEVVSSLDGFTNLLSGKPEAAPIRVYLHSETSAQRLYNQRVGRMLQLALPGATDETMVRHFSHGTSEAISQALHLNPLPPQPDACILTLDDWWARHLSGRKQLLELDLDPAEVAQAESIVAADLENGTDKHTHLPYILNAGVTVIHAAAWQDSDTILCSTLCNLLWEGSLYWNEDFYSRLEEAFGRQEHRRRDDPARRCAFSFDMTTQQSWACTLLEVLMGRPGAEARPEVEGDLQLLLAEDSSPEALFWFRKTFWLGHEEDPPSIRRMLRSAFRGDIAWAIEKDLRALENAETSLSNGSRQPHVSKQPGVQPLLRRSWYNTVLGETYEGMLSPSDFRLAPVVGGRTISGHWFLGALARSTAPETARHIVKSLSLRTDAIYSRFSDSVGLPTWRLLYQDAVKGEGSSPLACDLHTPLARINEKILAEGRCVSRLRFVGPTYHQNYLLISQLLARLLFNVLMLEDADEATLRQGIAEEIKMARQLLSRGLTPDAEQIAPPTS